MTIRLDPTRGPPSLQEKCFESHLAGSILNNRRAFTFRDSKESSFY